MLSCDKRDTLNKEIITLRTEIVAEYFKKTIVDLWLLYMFFPDVTEFTVRVNYTGLLKMIVWVLTTCHTQ